MQVVAVGHGGGRLIAGWLDTGSKYLLAMALTRCRGTGVAGKLFEALSHTIGPISGDASHWMCQLLGNFSL